MTNRRKEDRHLVELTIELASGPNLVFLATSDLSPGGAFFAHAVPYPLGTKVRARFTLPGDARAIDCAAEIVASRPGKLGMGVRFLDLPAAELERIEKFVASQPLPVEL